VEVSALVREQASLEDTFLDLVGDSGEGSPGDPNSRDGGGADVRR
jgi:hypothetical protein